ncbi:AAA family ATPase [Kribbella sp. NPDC023855]|uniref:ATP-binding protein n=1 Tax=Kribbella sp. NPDC023855 TaxID=3154698 RepID=UPI003406D1E4
MPLARDGSTALPSLFEREAQIGQLIEAVAAARKGRSSVALVTGEAGIGKTSLVRSFAALLKPDVRTLTGGCDDLLAPPALGPLREAFVRTEGTVAEALGQGSVEPLFNALIGELADDPPTVLILEDLQWADDTSLDVIRYVVRRLDRVRAVLVLTFRSDALDSGHPLRALLGEMACARAQRIVLAPLTLEAVRVLAGGSGWDPEELHTLTGGNPFYVAEVLAGPAGGVPASVVDATLARTSELNPGCLDAVEQLSVVPTRVSFDLGERLLGERFSHLADAERSGILEVGPEGIRFRHELARRAVEHSLSETRRIILNRAVVRAMSGADAPELAALVHHAMQAGDIETVVAHAPTAARQASRSGSHRQALTCFDAVLPYAVRLDPRDRAQLLDEFAWELHIAHRFADAVEIGRQAVMLYESVGESAERVETLLRLSRHQCMAGDTDDAQKTIERASEVTQPLRSLSPRAATLTHRGMLLTLTGRLDEALGVLEKARDLAAKAERPDLVSLCLNYLGTVLADSGDPRGLTYLRESLTLALEAGAYESAARAYANTAEVLFRHSLFDELAACLDEGQRFTQERGFSSHAYNIEVHRAQLDLRCGKWDAAERRLRRLLDSVDEPGVLSAYSTPVYARLLARRGDLETAGGMLTTSWQRAWKQKSLVGILYAGVAYAEWAWLSERPDVAREISSTLSRYPFPRGADRLAKELRRYLCLAEDADQRSTPNFARSGPQDDPYERSIELVASGSPGAARWALRILEGLGARAAVARIKRDLESQAAPAAPGPGGAEDAGGLTSRQIEVLLLLSEGLTNAEIARRLVLSVRTVDHHVSAILARLGAQTRHEAVAAAASLGLPIGQ